MSFVPLTSNDFDLSRVAFKNLVRESVKVGEKESICFKSYLSYDNSDEKGCLIQTPKLPLHCVTDNYLEVFVTRHESHKKIYKIFSGLEKRSVEQVAYSSKEWFKKDLGKDDVNNMFRTCIVTPETMDDPFLVRIPLDSRLEVDDPGAPVSVRCLVKVDGIIFGRNTCKLDFRVVRVKMEQPEPILSVEEPSFDPVGDDKEFFEEPVEAPKEQEQIVLYEEKKEENQEEPKEDEDPVEKVEEPKEKPAEEPVEEPIEESIEKVEVSEKQVPSNDNYSSEEPTKDFPVGTIVHSKYFVDGDYALSKILAVNRDSYEVVYQDGTTMEVSKSFVKELPKFPEKNDKTVVVNDVLKEEEKKEEKEEKEEEVKKEKFSEEQDKKRGRPRKNNEKLRKHEPKVSEEVSEESEDSEDDDEVLSEKPFPIHPDEVTESPANTIKRQIQAALQRGDMETAMKLGELLKQFQ